MDADNSPKNGHLITINLINNIKEHKDMLFIIPVIMYIIGFLFEYSYFYSFHVNVIYYITPIDLILSLCALLFEYSLLAFVHFIIIFILKLTFNTKKISSLIIPTSVMFYITMKFTQLSPNNEAKYVGYLFAVTAVSGLYTYTSGNTSLFLKNIVLITFISMLFLFGININKERVFSAKQGFLNSLSFKYNGAGLNSNTTTSIFIGETRDYIFLYNKKCDETRILKKDKIDSLIIKKPLTNFTGDSLIINQSFDDIGN